MNKISTSHTIKHDLISKNYSLIRSKEFNIPINLKYDFHEFVEEYNNLKPDNFLKDNKSFRLRRLRFFYWNPTTQELLPLPHRSYFQPKENNQYVGGIHRHFESMTKKAMENRFLKALISFCTEQLPVSKAQQERVWQMEIHQIRILATNDEPGEPTPEGIHRDGDDFGWIFLMGRKNVKGGVSGVYTNKKELIIQKRLKKTMDAIVFWDERVMHDASPIRKKKPNKKAYRDILIVSFKAAPNLVKPEPFAVSTTSYNSYQ